jgi:hypothetical protein
MIVIFTFVKEEHALGAYQFMVLSCQLDLTKFSR